MSTLLIHLIRAYRLLISPLLPPNTCRFHPSCSQYAIDAIGRYGAIIGIVRSIKRVSRCHPFHPGGYDPA